MPRWLREAGSPGPNEEIDDSGFVYYGRHFRSADGATPFSFGPNLQHHGSVTTLTLPADNGTWGAAIVASAKDAALRALLDADCWTRTMRAFPLSRHWVDAEPISDVKLMAKIEYQERRYVIEGVPVATGVVPLADAWACTNPSLGRGISIGVTHAASLRELVREHPLDDARAVAERWSELTAERVEPFYADTLWFDRHRLAEIEAVMDGRPYETDDPRWPFDQAFSSASPKDPDILRGSIDIAMLLDRAVNVWARPGLADRARALADQTPLPGPDRAELLAVVAG